MQEVASKKAPEIRPTAGRTAPGPRGLPFLGSLTDIRPDDMIQFYTEAWRQYGDTVRFRLGPVTAHLLAHPESIKHVLVDNEKNYRKGSGFRKVRLALGSGLFTADGALWRRQRRIMQPPFTPKGTAQFAPAMTQAIAAMLARWERELPPGRSFDVNVEMMNLAMSIIARTMLSIDIGEQARDAAAAFSYVLDFVSRRSVTLFDLPRFVPTPDNRAFNQSIATLDRFIEGVIDERRRDPHPPDDLLTLLLNARDPESGEAMEPRQVRDEVLTIFFAGHETTAQALTWAWFLLAQHPEQEAQMQAEGDRVLAGRIPELADVPELRYTRMVLDETMRIYPPVWVFARDAIEDDDVGGYFVPAGSMIMLSQYITHRHPAFWEAPERFMPERFSPEETGKRPRYAYFPFGGGPRICLGNNFALLEGTLALAAVAQRYRLRLVPGQEIAPRMLGTLRPSREVLMTLEPRQG